MQPDRESTPTDPEEALYSVSDAVRQYRISERVLRTAIAAGRLQVVRLAGLRRGRFPVIRIPESSLSAWLERRRCAQ
jgi:helix-turn-helix protein